MLLASQGLRMQSVQLKRRKFVTLLGGATAWPLMARAQQPATQVIGFLDFHITRRVRGPSARISTRPEGDRLYRGRERGDRIPLGQSQLDRLPQLAAELVRQRVAVIVTGAPPSTFAAKVATITIPIVFGVAEDPVTLGLVASLARPGGNVTGINFVSLELAAKRLELLGELMSGATRVAVLVNPANASITAATLRDVETAARSMGLRIQVLNANTSREIDEAFATFVRSGPTRSSSAAVPSSPARRVQPVQPTAYRAVPATYPVREYTEIGGLMSYGASLADAYRQIGVYTGRILKGAKPADLPVVQAIKFELVINLRPPGCSA